MGRSALSLMIKECMNFERSATDLDLTVRPPILVAQVSISRRTFMVEMSIVYTGEKHCELTHGPSKSKIETDAPRDNQGRGERFSPTDLVGAALASCVITTMAIFAERDGVELKGATATFKKEMSLNPRKIASLPMKIHMPKGLSREVRSKLEAAAETCPVKRSLHPDIVTEMDFVYPD